MNAAASNEYWVGLVKELCKQPRETEWLELKENNSRPEAIGEYISALANSAALHGKASAFLLWGVSDSDHEIVGTSFSPADQKKGNEPLENWLLRLLDPKINFRFHEVWIEGHKVVLLEVARATHRPVSFKNAAYVRIGSVTKSIRSAPDRERDLWRIFDKIPFEDILAAERLDADEVLARLDYPAYFDLLEHPLPSNREGLLRALQEDDLVCPNGAGGWDITNLGAILFAKKLSSFKSLKRKALRVIQYNGRSRTDPAKELEIQEGYAAGFEGFMRYLDGLIPVNEVIDRALRRTVPLFPPLAVRELVANSLIHQDFFETGAGPMIELFEDRLEITNPGEPLVDTDRFVDTPPKSRNESLASLMRRFRICEERGSGIDKVVGQVEAFQLPAPLFEAPASFTRVVLFAHKDLKRMNRSERVRACYLHACLRYITRDFLTNPSLRERFGIEPRNSATASRYIREAMEAGVIKPFDESAAKRLMKYVPFWA